MSQSAFSGGLLALYALSALPIGGISNTSVKVAFNSASKRTVAMMAGVAALGNNGFIKASISHLGPSTGT